MNVPIVSFYCDVDRFRTFERYAERMISQCRALELNHRIVNRCYGSNWISNVLGKPTFLIEMYFTLRRPFLWIDVDSKLIKQPVGLDTLECDFASVKKGGEFSIWDSVHYVGHSPTTLSLLREWEKRCQNQKITGSHKILDDILKGFVIPDLELGFLPKSYIFGPVIQIGISRSTSKSNYLGSRWRQVRSKAK